MTEFSHSPIKKITIQQMVQVTLEEFRERLLRVPGAGHAKWIDGILFVYYLPKDTDEVVHNELQGILFWNYFEFCKCEQIPPPDKKQLRRNPDNGCLKARDISGNGSMAQGPADME